MLKSTQKVKPDATRSHRWLIRTHSARRWLPTEALETPITIQALATVACGLPELNVETLLQRRMLPWAPGLREAKLRLDGSRLCEQASIMPEVVIKDARES